MLKLWVAVAAVGIVAHSGFAQTATAPPPASTLAGVVRDTAGVAISNVEVYLRGTTHATRTNDRGEFTLAGVEPGTYRAFFRRLGYRSMEYAWAPVSGERTEVAVALEPIPRNLDPVIVRAEEDKRYAAHASIKGIVVDSAGVPLEEAEVRIVGANTAGMTRANGGFLFTPLPLGAQIIRVRKIGYSPVTLTVDLHADDERELYIRMTALAHELDPFVVYAQSGFGSQRSWDELERRKHWVDASSRMLGPDELRRYYSFGLDEVAKIMNLRPDGSRTPARFKPDAMASPSSNYGWDEDSCILLNGTTPIEQPLHTFKADEIELLEIYPAYTELTGTVGAYFVSRKCVPNSLLQHPTYYVIWLKGRAAK